MNYIVNLKPMSKPNRFGSCYITYIAQIIRACNKQIKINPINGYYKDKLLCLIIIKFITEYNNKFIKNNLPYEYINLSKDHCQSGTNNPECLVSLLIKTSLEIKQDIFSYFKLKIYPNIIDYFPKRDETFKKTICVHLRLDDLTNSHEYDGTPSYDFFLNKINKDNYNWQWHNGDYDEFLKLRNVKPCCRGKNMHQSPLSYDVLEKLINKLIIDNPEHKVILVSSPIGSDTIPLKYKKVQNQNIDDDLMIMINSDILVCSKSTFSMCAALFHRGRAIYMPKWGYITAAGIGSKYDKSKIKVF